MSPPPAFVRTTAPALKLAMRTKSFVTTTAPTPVTLPRPLPRPITQTPQHVSQNTPPSAPAKPSRILFWFRTDLRVADNTALHAAAEVADRPSGALVPVLVSPAPNAIGLAAELSDALSSRGSALVTVAGKPEACLLDLCKGLNLHAVYFNRSQQTALVREEARVVAALTEAGIHVQAYWGNTLFMPTSEHLRSTSSANDRNTLKNDVHTTLRGTLHDAVARKVACTAYSAAPASLPTIPSEVAAFEQVTLERRCGGGTSAALKLLTGMDKRRETVLLSQAADLVVSLKTHLDFGSVSPRMVAARVFNVMGTLQGRTFSELVWRTYASFTAHRAIGVRSARIPVS